MSSPDELKAIRRATGLDNDLPDEAEAAANEEEEEEEEEEDRGKGKENVGMKPKEL